jgi:hypothetical protein
LVSSRVVNVRAWLSIDGNLTSHDNHQSFTTSQGKLETVAEDDGKRKALSQLVRTSAWAWSLKQKNKQTYDIMRIDKI